MSKRIRDLSLSDRLWRQVIDGPKPDNHPELGPCRIWTGFSKTTQEGRRYGAVAWTNRHYSVHRVAYELTVGPIPPGWDVDRVCGEMMCVVHLEAISRKESVRRSRSRWPVVLPSDECNNGHEFTPANTRWNTNRSGNRYRRCRTCANVAKFNFGRRQAAARRERLGLADATNETLAERVGRKVNKNGPVSEHRPDLGRCWLWTAGTCPRPDGELYGSTWWRGKSVAAHRASYRVTFGPVPRGMELDHLCRVTLCVNPSHLEPVTHAENLRRGNGCGARNARKTHCKRNHEFTPENTYRNGNGRGCVACRVASRVRLRDEGRARREAARDNALLIAR